MNFAKFNVIVLQCLIAVFLKDALPKIVNPAMMDATNDEIRIIVKFPPEFMIIFATMLAPAAPERTPQTSPITSLQMELTLSAFLIKLMACLLPLTFLAAIAVNGSSEHDATARPIMSNKMLTATKISITTTDRMIVALERVISLNKLNKNESATARIKISNGHNHAFFVLGFV